MKLNRPNRFAFLALCLLMFAGSVSLLAQDLQYTLLVIDSLTGPDKLGRGYVQNGHLKAAHFIANEMKETGLQTFGNDYYQHFPVNVNTFPDTLFLSLDGKTLQAGRDYQPFACDPDIYGTFKVQYLKPKTILNPLATLNRITKHKNASEIFWVIPLASEKWDKDKVKQYQKSIEAIRYNLPAEKGGLIILRDKLTWELSQTHCAAPGFEILSDAFNEKITSLSCTITSQLIQGLSTQNVIAYIPGTTYPDSFVVFTAHYDHLGAMGPNVYIPGANDNASGIAMLLNLAHFFVQEDQRLPYSVVFMAFGGEELGLLGSKYFTEHPLFPLENIRFLINMDMLGTGSEGITVVNGRVYEKAYKKLTAINNQRHYLPSIKARGKAANSDHYFFSEAGVPAFFIYTRGGIKAYHDIYDRPETLPLTAFMDLFNLLVDFVIDLP